MAIPVINVGSGFTAYIVVSLKLWRASSATRTVRCVVLTRRQGVPKHKRLEGVTCL